MKDLTVNKRQKIYGLKKKNLHHISWGGSRNPPPPTNFMSRNYCVSLLDFLLAPTGTCNLSMYTMYKLALGSQNSLFQQVPDVKALLVDDKALFAVDKPLTAPQSATFT